MDGRHEERVTGDAPAPESAPESARESAPWAHADAWPTAKQRAAVEQSARRVLDALVPERAPPRHGEPRGTVQRYRSPRGCILQDDARAVSVSWFPATATDETLGELRVITWAGVVSRPGATHRAPGGARPVAEALLHPVELAADVWAWRTDDGMVLASGAVAEHCLDLLAQQPTPHGTVTADA
jgi:hypothetical protein